MRALKDLNVKGKKVLLRCDFNVPLDERGLISDDSRIKENLGAIKYLTERGARVILMSHFGRPEEIKDKKERIKKFTLKPVAEILGKLLEKKVELLSDCIGEKVEEQTNKMGEKDIVLLENLRFYEEEEKNDQEFAKKLAKLGEIYVNDAFSVCHRAHASVVGIPQYLPSAAGLLLEKEIKILSRVLKIGRAHV